MQHADWQARSGNNLRVRSPGMGHPRRHRQWPAVGPLDDIVSLVVKVVLPDHRQALCTQRMEAIVNRNFSRTLLMGSMSFSCSRLSNRISG